MKRNKNKEVQKLDHEEKEPLIKMYPSGKGNTELRRYQALAAYDGWGRRK